MDAKQCHLSWIHKHEHGRSLVGDFFKLQITVAVVKGSWAVT